MSQGRHILGLSIRGFRGIVQSKQCMQQLCAPVFAIQAVPSRPLQSSGWGSVKTSTPHRGEHTVEQSIDKNLSDIRSGDFKSVTDPEKLSHFKQPSATSATDDALPLMGAVAMPHPIWTDDEVANVEITHKKPEGFIDHFAFYGVKTTRGFFDAISGFNRKVRDEKIWLTRLCFLETVAAVPGMVAAMVRHLNSLRKMSRDHGWIHTLLEEAENERMHLMTFLLLKQPSYMFRMAVVLTQGIFVSGFSCAYMMSPSLCHRFVGYLEEEAVVTYTKLLKEIDSGMMQHWKTQPASQVAIHYWNLSDHATMRDVILAIRADEAHHRVVNHTLGSLKSTDYNPYRPGE